MIHAPRMGAGTGGYPETTSAFEKETCRKMSLVKVNEKCSFSHSRTAGSRSFVLLVECISHDFCYDQEVFKGMTQGQIPRSYPRLRKRLKTSRSSLEHPQKKAHCKRNMGLGNEGSMQETKEKISFLLFLYALHDAVLHRELPDLLRFSSVPAGEVHPLGLAERKHKCCACDRSRYWGAVGRKVRGKLHKEPIK